MLLLAPPPEVGEGLLEKGAARLGRLLAPGLPLGSGGWVRLRAEGALAPDLEDVRGGVRLELRF